MITLLGFVAGVAIVAAIVLGVVAAVAGVRGHPWKGRAFGAALALMLGAVAGSVALSLAG
ncbi:hypothetical protein [Clavibacter nebraskensis]|uniref:hypothetical protein n=1 Tax=Clavibacter nebraskensis TaxID=31963 RepID=UPI003F8611B2